jgi:hypothetical protein
MDPGRLICVRKYQGDPATVAHVVGLSESAPAKMVIQDQLGVSPEYIVDIGSVSPSLMAALGLEPGGYVRADDPKRGLWRPS